MQVKIKKFREVVWDYYKNRGRQLPWRETRDPYKILVSEIMLQQTQVSRVLQKYPEFLSAFPNIEVLADAPLSQVLNVWQGMGYNRRAKSLYEAAQIVERGFGGTLPKDREALLTLPGIGPSTAGGILAFAYNTPVVFIETNIRRVFIHHFFSGKERVGDKEIEPLVERTLDVHNPREWYYALFDYGSALAREMPNPNRQSRHYTRQTPFEGSHRQVRSTLLKELLKKPRAKSALVQQVGKRENVHRALSELESEGFIEKENNIYKVV